MTPALFTPLDLGGITLPNRIVVSPMCQYSADDGCMNDWHFVHLGHLAYSGAGLLMVEATHVTREGRITHGCTGLYNEHNEASIKRVVDACRRVSKSPIGIQIGHAGRKASSQVPWQGRDYLQPDQSPWPTLAPRGTRGAMIEDAAQSVRQALDMVEKGFVTSLSGKPIPVSADTLCLHGDQPGAVTFARAIRQAFADKGIRIAAA